ncbi:DUF6297 family protein [Nonomuraea sp. NPDC050783]|uniref:DUF6297 family protein n=1 Tax=Nonomuraea sp. NPDC050783 TaxID=3154634 RepID=UPI003466DCA3
MSGAGNASGAEHAGRAENAGRSEHAGRSERADRAEHAGGGGAGSVREVRGFLRARSRARSTPFDRYVTGFSLLVLAAVAGQPVSEVLAGLATSTDPARAGAGLALLALGLAAFLAAARAAGPVLLTAPDASWLLLSPLDRRRVLGRTGWALLAVAVGAGAVLGLGLLAALGAPDQLVWRALGALALGVSASVGATALAVLSRASQTWQVWLAAAVVTLLVLAVVAVGGQARTALAVAASAPLAAVAAAASGAALAAALLVRRAWAALGRIPAREIAAASTRGGHVANAAMGADPGVLTWIAEDNHWRARKLRSRSWPSLPAPLALAWQDWRRLARRPGRLAVTLATAALPAVLAEAGGTPGVLAAAVLAGGLAVAATAATGARRDADNPALARLAGVGRRPALAARALLPALLAAAWTTASLTGLATTWTTTTLTEPAAGVHVAAGPAVWWPFGLAMAPALAAGALRMARRSPVDHSLPVIDLGAGGIPLGPLLWAVTGLDLAVAGCLPALVALASAPAHPGGHLAAQAVAGAAVLAGYVLRSGRGAGQAT